MSDLDRGIVTATPEEMREAKALGPPRIDNESSLRSVAESCFTDHSMDSAAKSEALSKVDQHKLLLLPLIESNPDRCVNQLKPLATMASKKFDPQTDPFSSIIKVILHAGKTYLSDGHAENDVLLVSPFFRGMLYQVGSAEAPNEEMLLQGSTFVPTKTMPKIIEEFEHLILFVLRTKPGLLQEQLSQAEEIQEFVIDNFSDGRTDDELLNETAKRINGTNILFGMMISVLTENPIGLKPNVLHQYLIGRGLKSVSSRSYLVFRAANEISKNSNNLLRLMRHMVCGHICRTARRDDNFDHDVFMRKTYELLRVIQTCDSTSSICKCIRMGREIDRKHNPSKVHKAFDPNTGEVRVGQSYVKKSTWDKMIPETAAKFKFHLYSLFQCHALLDMFLNVENKLIMTGTNPDAVHVLVKGRPFYCLFLILPISFSIDFSFSTLLSLH